MGKPEGFRLASGDAELEVGALYLHDAPAGEALAVFVCNADGFGGVQRVIDALGVTRHGFSGGDVVCLGLLSGRSALGGNFFTGDNRLQGDADETNATAAVFTVVVAGLVEDAHMVVIAHGNARVAHALANIVQVALVPCVAVIVGGAVRYAVAVNPSLDCIVALLCSGCAEHVGNFRHTLPLGEFENADAVVLRVYCYIGVDVRDRQ